MKAFQANLRLYRSELKGIAILWVVFFHAQLGLSGVLGFIQQIGYGGVDLFFFLSGFGLYHSLAKDSDPRRYLLRRARRLLPAYLPFCCIWLCVMLPLYRFGTVQSLRTAAGNLFMLGFFANVPAMINWYISALALSLLLAPLMAGFLSQNARQLQSAAYLIVGLFAMGLCFIGTEQYMAIARMPIFALGMAAALPAFEDRKQKRFAPLAWLGFLVGMLLLLLSFAFFPKALNTYGHVLASLSPYCTGNMRRVLRFLSQGSKGGSLVCTAPRHRQCLFRNLPFQRLDRSAGQTLSFSSNPAGVAFVEHRKRCCGLLVP